MLHIIENLIDENFPSHIISGGIPNQYSGNKDRFYFPDKMFIKYIN